MSETKRRFFSGDTLQQALVQAANHFHLQPEEVAFQPIEKRHGFTKTRRKVLIEVDPEAPKRPAGAVPPTAPAPVRMQQHERVERPQPAERGERPERANQPERADRPEPADGAEGTQGQELAAGPGGAAFSGTPAGGAGSGGGGGEATTATASVGSLARRPAEGQRAGFGRGDGGRRPERGGRGDSRGGGGGSRPGRGEGRYEGGRRASLGGGGRGGERPSGGVGRERRPIFDVEDMQPPASGGEGLVALPERPRSVSERYPQAEGPQAEAAAKGVELLLRIAGLDLKPRIFRGEERLEIDLVGGDTDWCFADDGELLMAIEHLLPRIIRSLAGEAILCRVDCDNFHDIREERLRSLAQKVADEVRQRGRARTLVPMNPADRRIIHVTLADDPGVATESEGDGYFKRITVRPT